MKGEKAYDAGSIVPALAQNARAGHPLFVLCPRFQRLGHPSNPNRQDASVTVETSYFTQITITFKSPGCRLNRKSSKFECYRLVRQLTIAASRIRLWLVSGRGCQ